MNRAGEEGAVLYSYVTSPFAAKVHAGLLFKQVPFQVHYVHPARISQTLPVGRQIPVLSVNDQHLAGSDAILYALDDLFPDRPLIMPRASGQAEQAKAFNDWATANLIPYLFGSVFLQMKSGFFRQVGDGWRLGHAMRQTVRGKIPRLAQLLWPLLLRSQSFIRELARQDLANGPERGAKLALHIETSIGRGPFLFEAPTPSLADVVLYALTYPPRRYGLEGMRQALLPAADALLPWMSRMQLRLAEEPPLVPTHVTIHPPAWRGQDPLLSDKRG